jgi:hypothetical protein
MSAAAFARNNNLDPRRLSFWKRRLHARNQAGVVPLDPPLAFIQVASEVGPAEPAPLLKPAAPMPSPTLTIDVLLSNGIRLTIHPDTDLSRMVAVAVALSKMGTAC